MCQLHNLQTATEIASSPFIYYICVECLGNVKIKLVVVSGNSLCFCKILPLSNLQPFAHSYSQTQNCGEGGGNIVSTTRSEMETEPYLDRAQTAAHVFLGPRRSFIAAGPCHIDIFRTSGYNYTWKTLSLRDITSVSYILFSSYLIHC